MDFMVSWLLLKTLPQDWGLGGGVYSAAIFFKSFKRHDLIMLISLAFSLRQIIVSNNYDRRNRFVDTIKADFLQGHLAVS
jgi:hypothetical protein